VIQQPAYQAQPQPQQQPPIQKSPISTPVARSASFASSSPRGTTPMSINSSYNYSSTPSTQNLTPNDHYHNEPPSTISKSVSNSSMDGADIPETTKTPVQVTHTPPVTKSNSQQQLRGTDKSKNTKGKTNVSERKDSSASLASSNPKPLNNKNIYKIVIVGGGGVGKSAITIQFIQGLFVEDYDPTIEDSYRKTCTIDGLVTVIDILDTAGQEEYAAMRDTYIAGGESFLLTYAINFVHSYEETASFYKQILRIKDCESYPIILVGNKCDLDKQRQVPEDQARQQAKQWKVQFFETSAYLKVNIEEIFFEAVREIRRYDAQQELSKNKSQRTTTKKPSCALF